MSKSVDVKEFAGRVERLCDFLLNKNRVDGLSDTDPDIRVIHDIKEDAADLHTGKAVASETLTGLSNFMKGF